MAQADQPPSKDPLKARIAQIHRDLEHYSYYQLLNLSEQAGPDEIRRAFHRMAANLHPDRYHSSSDEGLRKQVYAIYKRISEGYRVLMDDQQRRAYDAALAQGERRLLSTERPQAGPRSAETAIKNPKARKFYSLGRDAELRGDKKGARLNYRFALDVEGECPVIQERLDKLD